MCVYLCTGAVPERLLRLSAALTELCVIQSLILDITGGVNWSYQSPETFTCATLWESFLKGKAVLANEE